MHKTHRIFILLPFFFCLLFLLTLPSFAYINANLDSASYWNITNTKQDFIYGRTDVNARGISVVGWIAADQVPNLIRLDIYAQGAVDQGLGSSYFSVQTDEMDHNPADAGTILSANPGALHVARFNIVLPLTDWFTNSNFVAAGWYTVRLRAFAGNSSLVTDLYFTDSAGNRMVSADTAFGQCTSYTLTAANYSTVYTGKPCAYAPGKITNGSNVVPTILYYADADCTQKIATPTEVGTYYVKAKVSATPGFVGKTSAAAKFTIKKPVHTVRDTKPDTWVGGSPEANCYMPTYEDVGGLKDDRTVGMFYYLWHTDECAPAKRGSIFNLHEIGLGNQSFGNPYWYHYWDEPFLGYYRNQDPFVIRKHAQMLTDAGVDVILFDNTNPYVYEDVIKKIISVYIQMREEGNDTPYICSVMHNTEDVGTPTILYENFFADTVDATLRAQVDELWFKWNGKYLLLADREQTLNNAASPEIFKTDFTVRTSWTSGGKNCWPWMSENWGAYGYTTHPEDPEQTYVATADPSVRYVGKSAKKNGTSTNNPRLGTFFKAQWSKALEINPRFIFVTQFNEWIAMRIENIHPERPGFAAHFIDLWDWEYNRDIEPMRAHGDDYGYGDNYMVYLNYYVRKYKGVRQIPTITKSHTINIGGDFAQWDSVEAVYLDDLNDTIHRNFAAANTDPFRTEDEYYYYNTTKEKWYYRNTTGRNDFDTMKVASDAGYIYFYAKTSKDITAYEEGTWMNLLLNTDANYTTGFYGYDYVIGRSVDTYNYASLQKCKGGWSWGKVGEIELCIEGNQMMLAVPREWLGYTSDAAKTVSLDFKWLDNVPLGDSGWDPMDFIDKGDVAPNDRYNYRYKVKLPAIRTGAVSRYMLFADIIKQPDIASHTLAAHKETFPQGASVQFLTTPREGTLAGGIYTPQNTAAISEKLRYHLLDSDGNVLAFGILLVHNKNAFFDLEDIYRHRTSVNEESKTITLLVSPDMPLDALKFIPTEGKIYINGTDTQDERFNLSDSLTGHTLTWVKDETQTSYTLNISRQAQHLRTAASAYGLPYFVLTDPVTGENVTQSISIDHDAKTITAQVAYGVPLTSLKAHFTVPNAVAKLSYNGTKMDASTNLPCQKPITLTYTDTENTIDYTLSVTEAPKATASLYQESNRVKLCVNNTIGAKNNARVLLACFDADGRLLSVISRIYNITVGTNIFDISIQDDCPKNTQSITVLSWDSYAQMTPILSKTSY